MQLYKVLQPSIFTKKKKRLLLNINEYFGFSVLSRDFKKVNISRENVLNFVEILLNFIKYQKITSNKIKIKAIGCSSKNIQYLNI